MKDTTAVYSGERQTKIEWKEEFDIFDRQIIIARVCDGLFQIQLELNQDTQDYSIWFIGKPVDIMLTVQPKTLEQAKHLAMLRLTKIIQSTLYAVSNELESEILKEFE